MRLLLCTLLLVGAVVIGCGEPQPDSPPTRVPAARLLAPDADAQAAVESVLIRTSDLPDGFESQEELAAAAGVTPEPVHPVRVASIDPGIEDPDLTCAVANLVAQADGVKIATGSTSWIATDSGYTITSGAGVFASEANAAARFDAYVERARACPDETESWYEGSDAPFGFDVSVTADEHDVPGEAIALRIRTGIGSGFGRSEQWEIVARRGRVVAAIYVMDFAGDPTLPDVTVDVLTLARTLVKRLDAAAASLPDEGPGAAIPLWEADADAQAAADAAIIERGEFPEPTPRPPPTPIVSADGSVTTFSTSGARMYIMSTSPNCTAEQLRPVETMLARSGTGLVRAGADDYWHYAAVYKSERAAEDAVDSLEAAGKACAEEQAAYQWAVERTWTPLVIGGFDDRVIINAGVERWRFMPDEDDDDEYPFPPTEHVTTEASVIVSRGRMVATLSFVADGENAAAVESAVRLVIAQLEDAQRLLD